MNPRFVLLACQCFAAVALSTSESSPRHGLLNITALSSLIKLLSLNVVWESLLNTALFLDCLYKDDPSKTIHLNVIGHPQLILNVKYFKQGAHGCVYDVLVDNHPGETQIAKTGGVDESGDNYIKLEYDALVIIRPADSVAYGADADIGGGSRHWWVGPKVPGFWPDDHPLWKVALKKKGQECRDWVNNVNEMTYAKWKYYISTYKIEHRDSGMGNIILSHDGDSVDLTDWATAQLNLTPMQVEKLLNDKASKDYFTAVFGALANQC